MSGTSGERTAPAALAPNPAGLLGLLACPRDGGSLEERSGVVRCAACGHEYPYRDGVVSFLPRTGLDEVTEREQASRDREADWYASIFPEVTDVVEVPATLERVGRPDGPVLDLGAGTGRLTDHLARATGQPVVAVDYSEASLRLLVRRCAGLPVLAVHADARSLPLRTGSMAGAASAELYPVLRPASRAELGAELRRVLRPGAVAALSTLNYSLVFRLWGVMGNEGAREGEHLFGGDSDCYYVRQTRAELREELARSFVVEEVAGIRNIPARSIANGLGRVAGAKASGAFERFMITRGHRLDRLMERLPVSPATGFLLLAKVRASD
ncbi:MAG: methyltransferase domain-containing protein [Acidimicrobiia bacterium]|nr:methyltransferase domain-containing protein [Acidimicrobiia bacterium]